MKERLDILERKTEILQWISENKSKAFICKELQCKPETLNSYLKKMNIEYKGNQGSKGIEKKGNYKNTVEYLKGANVKSSILKQKLIRDGIKKNECEICNCLIWQNVELSLELHHIDGNHYNNDLQNLQILCPNCHSIQHKKIDKTNKCLDCGIIISDKAIRCKSCAVKAQSTIEMRVTRSELKNLIRTIPFTQIAKQFNITDNGVRKWCKHFSLPSTKKDINSYSNEEWDLI